MSEEKNLNALVPKELHKKLKMQLLRDELTFKDWLIAKIENYVEEE
jgi:predicted HicB family RNase H-like nuclease